MREEVGAIYPQLHGYREELQGKKAAIYVGGSFKAFSLVRALRLLGMRDGVVGSQTGDRRITSSSRKFAIPERSSSTIPIRWSWPNSVLEKDVDLFIGGVKERPIAYKLGVGFCDHNHERKEPLAGFDGMLNFAREVYSSVMSPVWQFVPRRQRNAALRTPAFDSMQSPASGSLSKRRLVMSVTTSQTGLLPQRLQTLHAAGRVPRFSRGGRGRSAAARIAGMLHLHSPLFDQSFSGTHRHRLVQFLRGHGGVRRRRQFKAAVKNLHRQYQPELIAVATTCLAETIGEDMNRLFYEYMAENWEEGHPQMLHVSTPSYRGTHMDGFHAAVRGIVEAWRRHTRCAGSIFSPEWFQPRICGISRKF